MKIAISSDLHIDLNHADAESLCKQQAHYLDEQHIDYYFSLGDAFNDFAKTQWYFKKLNQAMTDSTAYYLAGNHDMLTNTSAEQLEGKVDDYYFHNRVLDLPGTAWRIIGNNGWYDYSFSDYYDDPAVVAQWKRAYWVDRAISQDITDYQRMDRALAQIRTQLQQAADDQRKVIFLTHFVSIRQAVPALHFANPRRQRMWEMTKAMMGSARLRQLLSAFPQVREVDYGHLHHAPDKIVDGGISYYSRPVGVQRKEGWRGSLYDRWQTTLQIRKY